MTEEPMEIPSTSDELSRIEVLLAIARVKGSPLAIKDIDELTDFTPGSNFRSIWDRFPSLESRYKSVGGLLIEKDAKSGLAGDMTLDDSTRRRARAEEYVRYAREFCFLSGKKWVRVFSVAGSTSYKGASENDDVDIFCVTEDDSLWIYLTKTLLLARAFKLIRPKSPRFCFSFALEEGYARMLFASPHDALFARDALTIQVLHGSSFYNALLRTGQWISDYFPRSSMLRNAQSSKKPEERSATRLTAPWKALNIFLFLTVGNYIRLKSIFLSRKLTKRGQHDSVFRMICSRDHCIFESRGYQGLRRMYGGIEPYTYERQRSRSEEVNGSSRAALLRSSQAH